MPLLLLCPFVGCGSDEPAVNGMSDTQRQNYVEKSKASNEEQLKKTFEQQQGKNPDYIKATQGGSRPPSSR
jgi:hypothetical protein